METSRPRPSSGVRLDVLNVAQLYEQRAQSLGATGHDPSEAYGKALELRVRLFGPRHKLVLEHLQAAVRALHSIALQQLEAPPVDAGGQRSVRTLGKAVQLLHWFTGLIRGEPKALAPRPRSAAPKRTAVPRKEEDREVRGVLARLQSQTLNNLAQSYARLGDRRKAAAYLQQALALDVAGEELAATHLAFSSLRGSWGEKEASMQHAKDAVRLGEAAILNVRSLADQPHLFRDKVSVLATAYHNLGVAQDEAGEDADESFARATSLARAHLSDSPLLAQFEANAPAPAASTPALPTLPPLPRPARPSSGGTRLLTARRNASALVIQSAWRRRFVRTARRPLAKTQPVVRPGPIADRPLPFAETLRPMSSLEPVLNESGSGLRRTVPAAHLIGPAASPPPRARGSENTPMLAMPRLQPRDRGRATAPLASGQPRDVSVPRDLALRDVSAPRDVSQPKDVSCPRDVGLRDGTAPRGVSGPLSDVSSPAGVRDGLRADEAICGAAIFILPPTPAREVDRVDRVRAATRYAEVDDECVGDPEPLDHDKSGGSLLFDSTTGSDPDIGADSGEHDRLDDVVAVMQQTREAARTRAADRLGRVWRKLRTLRAEKIRCAVRVQAGWRGWVVRRAYRASLAAGRIRAVVLSWAHQRRCVQRTREHAVLILQATHRGLDVRRGLRVARAAAFVVQRAYRRWRSKTQLQAVAVVKLQAAWRRAAACAGYRRAVAALVRIQAAHRRQVAQRDYRCRRAAAARIISASRKCVARRRLLAARTKAAGIQAAARGWLARRAARNILLQCNAAIKLQATRRTFVAKRMLRRAVAAAKTIQRACRRWRGRRNMAAVVKLQSAHRRKMAQQSFHRTVAAVIRLQTAQRQHAAQRSYRRAVVAVVRIQALRRALLARWAHAAAVDRCSRVQAFARANRARAAALAERRDGSARLIQRVVRDWLIVRTFFEGVRTQCPPTPGVWAEWLRTLTPRQPPETDPQQPPEVRQSLPIASAPPPLSPASVSAMQTFVEAPRRAERSRRSVELPKPLAELPTPPTEPERPADKENIPVEAPKAKPSWRELEKAQLAKQGAEVTKAVLRGRRVLSISGGLCTLSLLEQDGQVRVDAAMRKDGAFLRGTVAIPDPTQDAWVVWARMEVTVEEDGLRVVYR